MKEQQRHRLAGNRMYPTEREERLYRQLKIRYGIKDALIVKSMPSATDGPDAPGKAELAREDK